jgi:hypothetical protein
LLGLGALIAYMCTETQTAIIPERTSKIVAGMKRGEVEAILGGPARDETGGSGKIYYNTADFQHILQQIVPDSRERWVGRDWGVVVYFHQDRVLDVADGPVLREETFFERFPRIMRGNAE